MFIFDKKSLPTLSVLSIIITQPYVGVFFVLFFKNHRSISEDAFNTTFTLTWDWFQHK